MTTVEAADLKAWISASPESLPDHDSVAPDTAQTLETVARAAEGSPLHKFLLGGECARLGLFGAARSSLREAVALATRPAEALIRLNALFALGVLLHDGSDFVFAGEDEAEAAQQGLSIMRLIAGLDDDATTTTAEEDEKSIMNEKEKGQKKTNAGDGSGSNSKSTQKDSTTTTAAPTTTTTTATATATATAAITTINISSQVMQLVPEHELLLPASELVASAQYNLGRAYYEGGTSGVSVNDAEAVRWWKAAAREGGPGGCTQAQNALGDFYCTPRLVDPSNPLIYTEPDFKESLSWHMAAAKNGNVDSILAVGLYYKGLHGGAIDNGKALQFICQAAEAADAACPLAVPVLAAHYFDMRLYGKCMEVVAQLADTYAHLADGRTIGVTESLKAATEAIEKLLSVQLRYWLARAFYSAGRCNEIGHRAVPKDIMAARNWYSLATCFDYKIVQELRHKAAKGLI